MMKKSTFGAVLAFFLCCCRCPDRRRPLPLSPREELDEYERLLFSDDGDDYDDDDDFQDDTVYENPPRPARSRRP